ncbi:TIR domain-containing protein [Telluribacter sp. SYSU D00476]|uniref:TIR domain-containing protein n=1 Tax=Telluribacter sp. SYSU D00476 TaxID=2811430 RepID=UPI001FF24665|nr:TIR domain-containing protein [Telluribacter sp. SYSU D00476]
MLAEELGRSLAEQGYGLVVGGWPGVDYLAAKGFAAGLKAKQLPLSDYLIQVVARDRPAYYPANASYPDFEGGYLITVSNGVREWIEAIKYADAVVIVGGEGGAGETYLYASQEQRPVFPLLGSGGDATFVYNDCVHKWELLPYSGFSKAEFIEALYKPVEDSFQAKELVSDLLKLIKVQLTDKPQSTNQLFISYAHEDRQWLVKLRNALRPLEKITGLIIWDDWQLQPGDIFKDEIQLAMQQTRIAILLVSDAYFESSFIQENELPVLLDLSNRGLIKLYWLQIGGELWRKSPLAHLLTIHDPEISLSLLSPAEQQDYLILLRRSIAVTLQ